MAQSLDELKNQINVIMKDNEVKSDVKNSKSDREILSIERELLESNLNIQFKKLISELDPEKQNEPFGGSGFKRTEYALSWDKWKEKTHRLILTNVTHNNSKLLIECPEGFKNDSIKLLRGFLSSMSESIREIKE